MANKTPYTLRKRGESWQANLSPRVTGGARVQRNYKTKAEAVAGAEKELRRLRDYGRDYLNLSSEQFRACAEAMRILAEKGFQATAVTDAARYFVDHMNPEAQRRTVAETLAEFVESRRSAGLSPLTLRDYQQKLGRFAKEFGDRPIHSLITVEIERWLDKIDAGGVTRHDYRRHLSILYSFAVKRKYAAENIAAAVSKVKVAQKIPLVLTADDARLLLSAARDHNLGCMLPYFAIGCFCGLRPWELRRTNWADVNLTTKEVYVTPEACKTAQDRYVTMPDNLVEWLQLVPEPSRTGSLFYSRKDFDAVRNKNGLIDKWQGDIMRHSAASHLYAKTQNAPLVTAQMGHGLGVFMKHYKRTVSQADGDLYFKVKPTDVASAEASSGAVTLRS